MSSEGTSTDNKEKLLPLEEREESTPSLDRNVENTPSPTSPSAQTAPTSPTIASPPLPPEMSSSPSPERLHTALEWFDAMRWQNNPFTFAIMPQLLVGYQEQITRVMRAIQERHKFIYIAGPTGSGKTTFLKWLASSLTKTCDVLYIPKPPERADQFIDMFATRYPQPWFKFWQRRIKTLYDIPVFLNERLGSRQLVVMFDEAHESPLDVLEWLRVLSDQATSMTVILSGLPVFESHLKDKLETFRKRIAAKIELVSLTKEETIAMVRARIQHVGGAGNEFTPDLLDFIYAQSGGFPREVLRVCDELVNQAILDGKREFARSVAVQEQVASQVSLSIVDEMTPMQREVVELLAKNPLTPGDIANTLDLEKYKSRQHAVRSINNIMKKLYEDGFLERRRTDKAYVYSLSGKLRTIVVKA